MRQSCSARNASAFSGIFVLSCLRGPGDDLAKHIDRDHRQCEKHDGAPAFDSKGNAAEHLTDPLADRNRNQSDIDDCSLDKHDDQHCPKESRVLIQSLKDSESVVPDIETVEESTHDEEYKVTRTMLRLIFKQAAEERMLQIQEADDREPCAHDDDLRHHSLAYNTLVSSSRRLVHVLLECRLVTEHDRSQSVHDKVDEQEVGDLQRLLNTEERAERTHDDRCHVDDELELAELKNIVIDRTSVPDRVLDRLEVIVEDNDLARFLGSLCTAAHREADISPLEGRGVVHTVARHTDDQIHLLTEPDHSGLVCRKCSRDDADIRDDPLDLFIAHFIELSRCQRTVGILTDQAGILRNCDSRLKAVTGDHDDLDARILDHLDRLFRFLSDIIADADETDEDQIVVDRIFYERSLGIAERKNAHRLAGQLVNFSVEDSLIDRTDLSVPVHIFLCLRKKTLRSTFIEGLPYALNSRLAELVGRIKALNIRDHVLTALIKHPPRILTDELEKSLIRHISADDPVLAVIHGACILTDRKIDETFDRAVLTELRNIDGIAVRRKEIDDLQLALCDRTGLITEENIQRPCCLDTDRLADKDIVVEHAARILHENERDHERQTFRDRADDDNDRKR